jgi:predicted regulator of Ras-like GTPase activity (Roadblock/LC7/MglB family)
MDPAKALADLTEISSQIEAAVLAAESGDVLASTFVDAARGEQAGRAAADLLQAARSASREGLVQLEAATEDGSVFVVRDGGHLIAAITGPNPTVGLVFYDLKTCLRMALEQPPPAAEGKPAKRTRKKGGAGDEAS